MSSDWWFVIEWRPKRVFMILMSKVVGDYA